MPRRRKTNELALFKEVWGERSHTSFLSGKPLKYFDVKSFAHVLAKGKYPKLRLLKENIILLTAEEHHLLDQGTDEQRRKYELANSCSFESIRQLKQKIIMKQQIKEILNNTILEDEFVEVIKDEVKSGKDFIQKCVFIKDTKTDGKYNIDIMLMPHFPPPGEDRDELMESLFKEFSSNSSNLAYIFIMDTRMKIGSATPEMKKKIETMKPGDILKDPDSMDTIVYTGKDVKENTYFATMSYIRFENGEVVFDKLNTSYMEKEDLKMTMGLKLW
jgi:hypothetical protein